MMKGNSQNDRNRFRNGHGRFRIGPVVLKRTGSHSPVPAVGSDGSIQTANLWMDPSAVVLVSMETQKHKP